MRSRPFAAAALLAFTCLLSAEPAAQGGPLAPLPARFIPNQGQWSSPELYRVQAGGLHAFLEPRGWCFWLREARPPLPPGASPDHDAAASLRARRALAVRMTFEGTPEAPPALRPGTRLAGHTSYLVGSDARRHRTQVPGFDSVRYQRMYEGIDVRLREGERQLEYDLLLEPGADLDQVSIRVEGGRSLRIDASGALIVETDLGELRQPPPNTWMVGQGGGRRPIRCEFVLRGASSFGFVAPDRDPALPLVIDPPLVYGSYLGGTGDEQPTSIRHDASGRILVCGRTYSMNFPTNLGAWGGGGDDGFVTCIDPAQPPANQLVFSTFVGGNGTDVVNDVQPRAGGLVSFCGATQSTDLKVTQGAYQSTYKGGTRDGLLGLLNGNGTLAALSYLGGSGTDVLHYLALGTSGECVLTGNTDSTDFPCTAQAYSQSRRGSRDGLIVSMDPSAASLLYSTYVGGSGFDALFLGYVDGAGVTAIGETSSGDFPMKGPSFDPTFNGGGLAGRDCVLLRLDPTRSPPADQLVYSTYLGGSGDERPRAAHPAANGTVVVTGTTASADFPTTAASYQARFQGGASSDASGYIAGDAFAVRIDLSKSGTQGLVFGTFLGGAGQDQGIHSCVDGDGSITLVGWTQANSVLGFPTTPDAMRRVYALNDGYVCRLGADGRQLLYGSYFGGTMHDGLWMVARHSEGVVTAGGLTGSADLPVRDAFQPAQSGASDAFVARLSLVPEGTVRYGTPSAGALGVPTIHALGDATLGNQQFGFACSRAPAHQPGLLLLSTASWPALPVLGVRLHVDIVSPGTLLLPVVANANGESLLRVAYPQGGLPSLFAQYVWFGSLSPLALSASDALRIR